MLNYTDLLDLEQRLDARSEDKLVMNPYTLDERVYFSAEAVDRYIRSVDNVVAELEERVEGLEDPVEAIGSRPAGV